MSSSNRYHYNKNHSKSQCTTSPLWILQTQNPKHGIAISGMPSLNKEGDKAARILKSFVERQKIPKEVIANAKGIAIFSGFRAAMWLAGTSGSGLVVARQPDGSWSAPSAFAVLSGGFGVAWGADVFDCVCVLNTQEAVDVYTRSEVKLGTDVSVAAGPVGGTADVSSREVKPVWTYVKSRGLYGAVAVDGTVIRERTDVNAEGYGVQIKAAQILRGEVHWPAALSQLQEVLRAAEGKQANAQVLGAVSNEPTPGDLTE